MAVTRVKTTSKPTKLVKLFDAVGDSTRFKLMQILAKECDICVSELANRVNITTAGASQHLKILEQANLVNRKRNGQKICYVLNDGPSENKTIIKMILG